MKRAVIRGFVVAVLAVACAPASALASPSNGVEHLHFAAGPYQVTPGANLILAQFNRVPKPTVDGFMIRMAPNLRYALANGKCCGAVPRTDIVHLHHGVWLTNGTAGEGEGNSYGGFYPFMASGEEKTIYEFPAGYGYPIGAHDLWILNYMLHNLTATPRRVYITYDIDFVPATSPLASTITPIHPIWMDVQDHHIYPIFNVKRGTGRAAKFTYPDMARGPYGSGPPLNEFRIDHPGTLVATAGHLHPGGLYDDLDLIRPGVTPSPGTIPGSVPGSVRLFRSQAHYFDKGGRPISWDFAMTGTPADWRPEVQPGDVLRVSATYDTRLASCYEVMGIMVVWEAWNDQRGINPFADALDEHGRITHGHLPENNYPGGTQWVGVNPKALPACQTHHLLIAAFRYIADTRGNQRCIPTIKHGQSITFVNEDASPLAALNIVAPNPFYMASIFHTVTSCKYPCTLNYGIAYPLAGGAGNFDSGELGVALPGVGTLKWSTPKNLPPGTYAFFCRIHPWMRGVFRVLGSG